MIIRERLDRIYAALGETFTQDHSKFGALVTPQPWGVRVTFDGGLSQAQLVNAAMQAVFHVAHLRDHLKRWACEHGCSPDDLETAMASSLALRVIVDLADRDKHGGSPRNRGYSGRDPRLTHVARGIRSTGGTALPIVRFAIGPSDVTAPEFAADAAAVISGPVFDFAGERIGDLNDLLTEALRVLEDVLARWQAQGPSASV
jgi:hypothetical protein